MPHPGLLGDDLLLTSITTYEFGTAPFQRLKLISLSSYSSLIISLVYTACYGIIYQYVILQFIYLQQVDLSSYSSFVLYSGEKHVVCELPEHFYLHVAHVLCMLSYRRGTVSLL